MTESTPMTHEQRVEELLRAIARAQFAPILQVELQDDKLAALYDMTGSTTAADAKKKLSIGTTKVVEAWKRWERLGLIVKDGKTYRKVL